MGATHATGAAPAPGAARLAQHVRTLGRGPGRSRSLSFAEARDAMAVILGGEAAPEAVGALLMLMRFRGETPDEIAGFVAALRDTLPVWSGTRPGLDWPCYAAGRSRGIHKARRRALQQQEKEGQEGARLPGSRAGGAGGTGRRAIGEKAGGSDAG